MYGRHRLHRAGADGQRRCCSGRRGGRRRQRGAHGPVPAVEPVQFVVRQKSYSPDGALRGRARGGAAGRRDEEQWRRANNNDDNSNRGRGVRGGGGR